MIFKHFSLPSCLVRTKGNPKGEPEPQPEPKPKRRSQRLPNAPPPRRWSPPKRTLLPYEYPPPSGRPSRFTQLPPELVLLIVESMDVLQRARFMLTCRYFRQVLEPTLYRHLNLLDPGLYRRSGRLLQTLHDRPSLISQIVTYHGPILPPKANEEYDSYSRRRSDIHKDPRWSVGLTIFQNAVNIRDLYFTDYLNWIGGYGWAPHREAVDDMVLDRLVIQVQDKSVNLVPLLRNQLELTRLELLWGGDGLKNLKKTDIPKLRSLSATLETAALIVPGRPVDEINLLPTHGAEGLKEDLLKRLSQSTRVIRKFEMKPYNPYDEDSARDALQALSRHLPAIEDLTIHVGGKISGRMLLLEIPAFGSISSLTLLDASLVHTPFSTILDEPSPAANSLPPNDSENPDSWADLEAQLKRMCPNFTSLGHTTLTYLGWKR